MINTTKTTASVIALPFLFRLETVLPVIGYALPLILSGPQIVTGTAVNTLLVLFALKFPKKHAFFMCALPGLGAVSNGILFGTYTPFLLYFLPFIWAANVLFVSLIRRFRNNDTIFMVCISAVVKSASLFVAAYMFVSAHFVPEVFLTAMGIVQLGTAVAGAIIAHGVLQALNISYARR